MRTILYQSKYFRIILKNNDYLVLEERHTDNMGDYYWGDPTFNNVDNLINLKNREASKSVKIPLELYLELLGKGSRP